MSTTPTDDVFSASAIAFPEERDSVEVTRDAKGQHKVVVKIYFNGNVPKADAKAAKRVADLQASVLQKIGA